MNECRSDSSCTWADGNVCKNTFQSLPNALKHRKNVVISSTLESTSKMEVFNNVETFKKHFFNYDDIYLIGGEQLYKSYINTNLVKSIYHTEIDSDYKCDTFFPEIPDNYKKIINLKSYDKDLNNMKEFNLKISVYKNSTYDPEISNIPKKCNNENLSDNFFNAIEKCRIHNNIVF